MLAALVAVFSPAADIIHGLICIGYIYRAFVLSDFPMDFLLGFGYRVAGNLVQKYCH